MPKRIQPLALFVGFLLFLVPLAAQPSAEPQIRQLRFEAGELPLSLFQRFTGRDQLPILQYVLPSDYSAKKTYPLFLYVPGFHGKRGGNIQVALDIAGSRDCIVASLPLFKQRIDRSEVADGVIVSFEDYPVISRAYQTMLQKLFEHVPNIASKESGMAGFSNGAITIAILVTNNDPFILEHFSSFCFVDQGMFHLTDLHKHPTRSRRFLFLTGDQPDMGRDFKLRAAQLLEDSYRLLSIDVDSRILLNTGHELTPEAKTMIGEWVFQEEL